MCVCVCARVHTDLSHHSCVLVPSAPPPVVPVCALLSALPDAHSLPRWTSPQSEDSPGSLDLAFFEGHVDLHTEFHPTLPGHRRFAKQGLLGRGITPLAFCWGVPTRHHPQREGGDSKSPPDAVLSWFSFDWSKGSISSCHLTPLPRFLSPYILDSWSIEALARSLGTRLLYSGNPALPRSHLPAMCTYPALTP
ncbi:hypothetical protein HJG60_008928 [Phyllostomus discolor]|uniref:Uncharacterized protein n=1 Tax=Phyllostomus discolor TaxID=89673 RepID=A0A834DLA9_9CHIR|nr:hypothetical protein HJG60_008928 [Phyllostomus discolor]